MNWYSGASACDPVIPSHPYGCFHSVQASLDFNPQELGSMRLDGIVEMASLDMNNKELAQQLANNNWFATDRYPQVGFKAVSVSTGKGSDFVITGKFQRVSQ